MREIIWKGLHHTNNIRVCMNSIVGHPFCFCRVRRICNRYNQILTCNFWVLNGPTNADMQALTHINADWLVRAFLRLLQVLQDELLKHLQRCFFYFTKAWQTQWKMLVCSLDEAWSMRPAPQVALPKHLLCEFPVGGVSCAYLAGPRWKNHTLAYHVLLHMPMSIFEAPLFFLCGCQTRFPDCSSFCTCGNTQEDFPIPLTGSQMLY